MQYRCAAGWTADEILSPHSPRIRPESRKAGNGKVQREAPVDPEILNQIDAGKNPNIEPRGLVVRTSDRTRNSIERLISASQKLSATYKRQRL